MKQDGTDVTQSTKHVNLLKGWWHYSTSSPAFRGRPSIYTHTHCTQSRITEEVTVSGIAVWLRGICEWRLGYSRGGISHIKYITVSHHKNQIAFPDHSYFLSLPSISPDLSLALTPPLHIMYSSQKFAWHLSKYSVFLSPCPASLPSLSPSPLSRNLLPIPLFATVNSASRYGLDGGLK